MKTITELKKEREKLLEEVLEMARPEKNQARKRLRLLDNGIRFLMCEPSTDFVGRQLSFIDKKIAYIKEQASARIEYAQVKTVGGANRIRARVYKEEGMNVLREQKAYVEFILD